MVRAGPAGPPPPALGGRGSGRLSSAELAAPATGSGAGRSGSILAAEELRPTRPQVEQNDANLVNDTQIPLGLKQILFL